MIGYKVSFSSEGDALNLIQKATKLASIELESSENFFKDLLTCVPMLTKDGQEYKFIHKTIIEFFSAYFLSYSDSSSLIIKKIIDSNLINSYKKSFDFLYQINKSLYIKEIGSIFLEDYINFSETKYLKYNNYFKTILFFSDDAVITLTKNIKEKNGIYGGYNSQHSIYLNGLDNNQYELSVSYKKMNKYDDNPILFFKSFMDNKDFNISHIFSNFLKADIKNIVDTLVLDQSYKITSDTIFSLTNNNILKGLCLSAMTNHLESNRELSAIIPEKCKSILHQELNKIDILDDL